MRIMTSLAAAAFAVASIWNVHAKDYYVDAVNGNDANDGLAAGEGHAMESFAALFAKYTITSGDKVHAGAGIYTNGVMRTTISGVSTAFRLVVPAGVEIIGAGADSTTIEGQAHTNELGEVADLTASPWGCGANALRGVYLYSGAILRNATIAKGYTPNYSDKTGGGILSAARSGYVIGCVITNCVSYRGALATGTAVGCRFVNNRGGTGCDIFSGAAFNCFFGNCPDDNGYNVYQGAPYVNCTFTGIGKCMHVQNGAMNVIYNSIVLKKATGVNTIFTNCIVYASVGTLGGGSVSVSGTAAVKCDANYRPLRDSPCVDAGDIAIYTNKFPAVLAGDMWNDCLGKARKAGLNIDAGACESPFTKNGAFDWHVDAVNGDDANDGTSADAAFQNLARAMTNSYLSAGDTVHAAPGMYTNGVIRCGFQGGGWRNFRTTVPSGVTLVGDAGAERTVIVGAPDPAVATDTEPYGCGSNAVQCVRFFDTSTATIRGFTLTGGRSPSYTTSAAYGGAVYCGDNRSNVMQSGFVIDCIVTNNCAARGAGVTGAVSIRCRFADNRCRETGCDVYTGRAYNCLFEDVANTSTYNFYGSGSSTRCVNCTFVGTGYSGGMSSTGCGFYNCVILKDVAMRMVITNCVYTGTLDGTASAGNSRKIASVEAVHLDASYRPLRNSPALDKADASYYALPEALADEAGYDFLKAARVQGQGLDLGAFESSATTASRNWYVDKAGGNDANDGLTAATAFKTFAAAMAAPELISNDVVNVAAGVYSDADGTMTDGGRNYRVVVPDGVTLQGTGANVTTIEGAEDRVNGTEEGHYCGSLAVACVRLNAGASVRGFTLTKGHTPTWSGSDNGNWGGAVNASGAAYVVDCVITNNFGRRGAGIYHGTAIRCRFDGNGAALTGTDIMQGSAYNCIFGDIVNVSQDSVYQGGQYVNCVFHGNGYVSHNNSALVTNIWNSIVLRSNPGNNVRLLNCAMTASSSYSFEGTSITLTKDQMMLDKNYAPRAGSPLIDRGNTGLYAAFPSDVAMALAKTDLAGSQRIYNGAIDIGAFEYDWRGDFAKRLRRSRLEVVQASESVVTNGTDALTVPANSSIEISWTLSRNGNHSFRAVPMGEDALATLTLNGETLVPAADGVYTFVGAKDTTVTIAVASADGESAVLRDFAGPGRMVLSFR